MNQIFTIKLENIAFFSYHGLYDIEKENGNNFLVNVTIKYQINKQNEFLNLEDILDYCKVYQIIESIMAIPCELLENLCLKIAEAIQKLSPQIIHIQLSISKLNPPLGGKCEKSTVVYEVGG
ncbi:MAG: dihydroneopterin aldolase [Cytophagales bacterium]|nr:MAG: dihydroneopterin aldolase [Cytophagales bacterium]